MRATVEHRDMGRSFLVAREANGNVQPPLTGWLTESCAAERRPDSKPVWIRTHTVSKHSSFKHTNLHAYTSVHSQCFRLHDLRVRRKWRGMNLVKKTPIRLHWRLSIKLSYRGGDKQGEIRKEKAEGKHRVTLQGEKCSPSAFFFFLILCRSVPLPWLVSFVKPYFF